MRALFIAGCLQDSKGWQDPALWVVSTNEDVQPGLQSPLSNSGMPCLLQVQVVAVQPVALRRLQAMLTMEPT